MNWLRSWTGARAAPVAAPAPPQPMALDAIRCQMVRAMRGCSERHRALAADQVMGAPNVIELWLLRGDLYQYLARDFGQLEAERRVDRLTAMFEGHVPEAGGRSAPPVH